MAGGVIDVRGKRIAVVKGTTITLSEATRNSESADHSLRLPQSYSKEIFSLQAPLTVNDRDLSLEEDEQLTEKRPTSNPYGSDIESIKAFLQTFTIHAGIELKEKIDSHSNDRYAESYCRLDLYENATCGMILGLRRWAISNSTAALLTSGGSNTSTAT